MDAAREQHPDERPVAHADAEHGDFFIRKGIKILVDKMIHIQSLLKVSCLYYIRMGKKLQSV